MKTKYFLCGLLMALFGLVSGPDLSQAQECGKTKRVAPTSGAQIIVASSSTKAKSAYKNNMKNGGHGITCPDCPEGEEGCDLSVLHGWSGSPSVQTVGDDSFSVSVGSFKLKIKCTDCEEIEEEEEEESSPPSNMSVLMNAFPNPVLIGNPLNVQINVDMSIPTEVVIEIIDMSGFIHESQDEGIMSSGMHTIPISTMNLDPGNYFLIVYFNQVPQDVQFVAM